MLLAVVVLILAVPTHAQGKTVVVIYGKGGVRLWPPAICPEQDPAKCADVTFESETPTEVTVADALDGANYAAVLAEPIPANLSSMPGSELPVESIEPLE